jgi:pilus assembly protein Flp/PilA
MKNLMVKFFKDESGATMVEYAILVALISIAAIVIIYFLGREIRNTFQQVLDCISNPTSCGGTGG